MKRWLATLAALTLSGVLWAQPQPPPPEGGEGPRRGPPPPSADANGDGKVDETEANQAAKQRLDMLKKRLEETVKQFDADGDGTLNAQEQAALKNKMAERGGNRGLAATAGMIDTNGDWKLSPEEEAAALKAMAQRLQQGEGARGDMARGPAAQDPDTNGDCMIDDTEARVVAERRVDIGRKLIERLRERAAENPDVPYPPMVAELDTDRNLDVSDAEAQAAVQRLMAELQKRNAIVLKYYDGDKDGKLNDTELAAAKTAFAFMREVRPEGLPGADRFGEAMRERFREGRGRPDGDVREGRREPRPGAGERQPLPPPPAAPAL